jgi:hypothetical protein
MKKTFLPYEAGKHKRRKHQVCKICINLFSFMFNLKNVMYRPIVTPASAAA